MEKLFNPKLNTVVGKKQGYLFTQSYLVHLDYIQPITKLIHKQALDQILSSPLEEVAIDRGEIKKETRYNLIQMIKDNSKDTIEVKIEPISLSVYIPDTTIEPLKRLVRFSDNTTLLFQEHIAQLFDLLNVTSIKKRPGIYNAVILYHNETPISIIMPVNIANYIEDIKTRFKSVFPDYFKEA